MMSVEEKVRQSLKNTPAASAPARPAAERYLELAANIVAGAIGWQDEDGRIIDPYVNKETNTVTARFVGALGTLIMHGKCHGLIETCAKSLTPALEDLFHKKTNWGEFIVKEACMAYMALKDKVSTKQAKYWAHLLADYDPEQTYDRTFSNHPGDLHNFCTFAIAGEVLKKKLGLANNAAFVDRYVEQQLTRFDKNGMYNDPNSPMTYDLVSRMNLTIAMRAGYDGQYADTLSDTLKKGGLAQLLCQSPTGECPFGGRSNQQNFNEATFALICEFEATRWRRDGDPAIAGAFKGAAALSINSIEKYLCATPIFFTKNMFPPETQHGGQKGYGFYGAYSLLIASQMGLAHWLSDDQIKAQPCPAECGGYVFETEPPFHKIFSNSNGVHIEIDVNALFAYDSTGLGRIHFAGCPPELALSLPITATPGYLTVTRPAPGNIAIGPGWDNIRLADLTGDELCSTCKVLEESQDRVKFIVDYKYDSATVSQLYVLSGRELEISVTQKEGHALNFQAPLLQTNGKDVAEIKILDNGFEVFFQKIIYRIECLTPNAQVCIDDYEAPNINGIYKTGLFTSESSSLQFRFSVKLPGAENAIPV